MGPPRSLRARGSTPPPSRRLVVPVTEVTGAGTESLVVDLSQPLDHEWIAVRRTPSEIATTTHAETGEGLREIRSATEPAESALLITSNDDSTST